MKSLMKKVMPAVTISIILSGCASNAPISDVIKSVETSKESIAFITLKVSNQKNRSYQPNIKYAYFFEDKTPERKMHAFKVIDPYGKVDNQYNEYVVSVKVKPGDYVFRELWGQSGTFPIIGNFVIPMYKKVSIPENKIVYLGHVEANLVDKTSDDQLRAGPIIPLIDQVVVGASTGTFLIDIQDRYDSDALLVKSKFPAFSGVNIENMTLSQWEKPEQTGKPTSKEMQ